MDQPPPSLGLVVFHFRRYNVMHECLIPKMSKCFGLLGLKQGKIKFLNKVANLPRSFILGNFKESHCFLPVVMSIILQLISGLKVL